MPARVDLGGPDLFLRNYGTISGTARNTIREFLEDPSERNVHDVRSALRRLSAAFRVVPRRSRILGKLIDKYEERTKELLKLTSPIRDIDIIGVKIEKRDPDLYRSDYSRRLKSRRRKRVESALATGWKLFEREMPRIEAQQIRGFGTRALGVISDLRSGINRDMVAVLESEENIDELHSLRKKCKKLRYTLELFPLAPGRKEMLEILGEWQDFLGAMLESDVLIAYLEKNKLTTRTSNLVRRERERRHSRYVRLVEACHDFSGNLPPIKMRAEGNTNKQTASS